jgi:uncharacterized protein YhfF
MRAMQDPPSFRGMQVCGFAHPGSDLRRELVDLVLAGTKQATAGLLAEYELDGDAIPYPGLREAVIGADGRFVGVIETTACRVLRMADVDDDFARAEGEGFADAAAWRAAHERFFRGYLTQLRERLDDPVWDLDDDTPIVCQRFRLAERFAEPLPPDQDGDSGR